MASQTLWLDESLAGHILTVGGFILPATRTRAVAERWRALKVELGLQPTDELKYSVSEQHPSRARLDEAGWIQSERVPRMLDVIQEMGIVVLADTMLDLREASSPGDFYLDALRWCVRRFANEVEGEDGVHWVVVDMPPRPEDLRGRELSDRLLSLHRHVDTAPFDAYQRQFWKPESFGVGWRPGTPLAECGLAPTLAAGHAKHSDPLQVADIIVGCVREFCKYNLDLAEGDDLPDRSYPDENMQRIAGRIRRGRHGVKGFGFDVFPDRHPARKRLLGWVDILADRA